MHIFILIFLSPLEINYNSIIWPWNVLMIVYLIILFYNNSAKISLRNLLVGVTIIPVLMTAILPFLSFVGLYDIIFRLIDILEN